jgi:hypothetical protein
MPTETKNISAERFNQGLTYSGFLAKALINHDKFDEHYESSPLTDGDFEFFRRARKAGCAKIVAIGEAWCGDVYRELPTVARIAVRCSMELRIFLRDENPDVMDAFLSNEGKSRAIPVFVFYTEDMRYVTHYTERPPIAQAEIDEILADAARRHSLPPGTTFTHLTEAARREVIAAVLPRFADWQSESIKEMRFLLSKALRIPD